MIKTPLSTVIGGAFWTPSATVIGGTSKTFNQLIKSIFANNEQGFFYDPNDLSTMFQDAAGTVPVTGAGQPVGFVLDKSKGLARELVKNTNFANGWDGWGTSAQIEPTHTIKIINDLLAIRFDSPTPVVSLINPNILQEGMWVEVEIDCAEHVSGSLKVDAQGYTVTVASKDGINKSIFKMGSTAILIYRLSTPVNMKIRSIKVSRILGNHAYQSTSAARPILQDTPRRIDFDAVDDKLITTLPTQLIGCTVISSVPNVGTQILTGQTIPTTYNDNTDHCGLIVINRALTPSETSAITAEFNKRAGV